jgi:hypothetical protein
MHLHPRLIAMIVLALGLTAPNAAFAQQPGVTFDDGPSSKEYAIPLDAARGQTKTKAPTARVRTTPQPATPAPPPAPATTTATTTTPKPKEPTKTETTQSAPAVVAAPTDPPVADATPASSGSDGTDAGVVIGGLALAAIVLGGLAGLLLRRRRQPIDEY